MLIKDVQACNERRNPVASFDLARMTLLLDHNDDNNKISKTKVTEEGYRKIINGTKKIVKQDKMKQFSLLKNKE